MNPLDHWRDATDLSFAFRKFGNPRQVDQLRNAKGGGPTAAITELIFADIFSRLATGEMQAFGFQVQPSPSGEPVLIPTHCFELRPKIDDCENDRVVASGFEYERVRVSRNVDWIRPSEGTPTSSTSLLENIDPKDVSYQDDESRSTHTTGAANSEMDANWPVDPPRDSIIDSAAQNEAVSPSGNTRRKAGRKNLYSQVSKFLMQLEERDVLIEEESIPDLYAAFVKWCSTERTSLGNRYRLCERRTFEKHLNQYQHSSAKIEKN